jgi:hypothetical protein
MALDLSNLTPQEQLAAIYIGYYDRAADPVGQSFWVSVVANPDFSLAEIATDFAGQAETLSAYPFLDAPTAEEAEGFIAEVFLNLFNRAPDQAGLDFWSDALIGAINGTNALTVGEIILSIIGGAQDSGDGNDRTTILNKIEAAIAWTDAAEIAGIDYTSDSAAQASAKSIIEGVTSDDATVDAAAASADSFFGTSLTLTADDQVGEGEANTFTAALATAAAHDVTVTFQLVAGNAAAQDQGTTTTNLNDFSFGAFNPVSVIIPAGTSSASFSVTALADGLTEVPEGYSVVATAGYTTVTDTATVLDGKTFTLTKGADLLIGTAGADSFVALSIDVEGADASTLTNFDDVDGGAGEDILDIYTDSGNSLNAAFPAFATVSGIEVVNVFNGNGAVSDLADASNFSGIEQLWQIGTAAAVTKLGSSTTAGFRETAQATALDVTATDTAESVTVALDDVADANLANGNDITLKLSGEALEVANVTGTLAAGKDDPATESLAIEITAGDDVTSLTLNSELDATLTIVDSDNDVEEIDAGGSAGGITFAGDVDVNTVTGGEGDNDITMTSATVPDNTATTAVDETENAVVTTFGGDDEVTVNTTGTGDKIISTGAGEDTVVLNDGNGDVDVDLGDGDDTLELAALLATGDYLDGGDGVDTLSVSAADAEAASATSAAEKLFGNFEKIELGAAAEGQTDTVNMANLDDIDYVVSNGTDAGSATGGTNEVAVFDFAGVTVQSGETYTIGDGTNSVTITADAGTIEGAAVASKFAAGSLTGYTAAASGTEVTFTSTTIGDKNDLFAVTYTEPGLPTASASETTPGEAAVTGVAEVATVTVGGLIAGETITLTDGTNTRVLTATSVTETATATFGDIVTNNAGDDIVISVDGLTVTLAAGTGHTYTGAEIAAAIADGTTTTAGGGSITLSGALNAFTAVDTAGALAFTAKVPNADVTDITITATGTAASGTTAPTVTTVDGDDGNLTAGEVATALAGVASATGPAVVADTGTFSYTGSATGNVATFTASAAGDKTDLTAATTSGITPTVSVTTQGVTAVTPVDEVQEVTFSAMKDGQSITVAGRTVTADGGDLTAEQVVDAFIFGVDGSVISLDDATITGTLASGWTITDGGTKVVFTSNDAAADDSLVSTSASNGAAPTQVFPTITDGSATGPAGNLTITNLADGGTLELVDTNNGITTVTMKDASGTSDSLNLKLNAAGTTGVVAGAVAVAGVEAINISTSDSATKTNPTTGATIALDAAAAETITLSGNHGLDFTGSTLTSVTTLNAAGVVADVLTKGLTAAQKVDADGVAGAVTFTTSVTDEAVSISTGNGNDVIDASSVGTTGTADAAADISTGAGDDLITGGADEDVINAGSGDDKVNSSASADSITLGAGNDTYVLGTATDSVLSARDVIADFDANTYGAGTAGAVTSAGANGVGASLLTGDLIDLSAVMDGGVSGIDVLVTGNAADAQTFLQNTGTAGTDTGIALDTSTGYLYIDLDSNGTADAVIELTGVSAIDEAAFVF